MRDYSRGHVCPLVRAGGFVFRAVLLMALAGCEKNEIPASVSSRSETSHEDVTEPLASHLLGVEAITDPLPYEVDEDRPVSMLLSRSRYPAEDGHLDILLWLGPEWDVTPMTGERLILTLHAEDGRSLWREEMDPIPGRRLFLSPRFPAELAGTRGMLRVEWFRDEVRLGAADGSFSVAPPVPVPVTGRVRLDVPNEDGVTATGVPMTVGVPFPRGALRDTARLRLVDETGSEVPAQIRETSRWSRFGSVKWVLCDFTADLDGKARLFHLEYGPEIHRTVVPGLAVSRGAGFPKVEAGRLRIDNGIWFRGEDGTWRKALEADALNGGYVVHESGREYRMDPRQEWTLEEAGPEKIVAAQRGWYVNRESGAGFCQYVTRLVAHRDSSMAKLFHTWIFTGDAYEDRVRDIGWRFPAADGMKPMGFLTSHGDQARWIRGDYLLQHDFDAYKVVSGDSVVYEGARAGGVMGLSGDGIRVLAGVRDFWQNFPHELGFADGGMTWHLWPRHGKPARHDYDTLDLSEFQRLWFAHEGELLDFAMPEQYFTRPEILASMHRHNLREGKLRKTANAQGVAKTTEIWLQFSEETDLGSESARLLKGLQNRTVRAVADPAWVCASGVFFEVHPHDPEHFPEEEAAYALQASAPARWAERLRYYGKWIWGDVNWNPNLRERYGVVYRGFRKAHQGWPYAWLPYARSGNPEYLYLADAATRYMADVAFCHYADVRADVWPGMPRPRPRGFHIRFSIPWASHRPGPTNRDYVDKVNYLWHAYYLTGYARARDVALDWGHLARFEPSGRRDVFGEISAGASWRITVTALKSFVDMYAATHEPWFLAAAHQVARRQKQAFREQNWTGQFWNTGPREFLRFTGCPEFEAFYLAYARKWTDTESDFTHYTHSYPMMAPAAFGWARTKDEYFLRRLRAMSDELREWTYDGEPAYYLGARVSGSVHGSMPQYTGYLLQHFPHALHALARARDPRAETEHPAPLHRKYFQLPPASMSHESSDTEGWGFRYPSIRVVKAENEPLPLRFAVSRFSRHSSDDAPWTVRIISPGGRAVLDVRWMEGHRLEGNAPAWAEAGDFLIGHAGQAAGDGGPVGVLQAEIPAAMPAGIYELRVTGHSTLALDSRPRHLPGMYFPVAAEERPEVMGLDSEHRIGPALRASRYAFSVPEKRDELVFRCDVGGLRSRAGDCPLVRMTLWNHRGERVGVAQADREDISGDKLVLRAPVSPEDAGEIWELAIAHGHSGVRFDPAITPWVSAQRERWFDPAP